jgi:hypothetical protein
MMTYEDLVIDKPVKVLIIDDVESDIKSIKERLDDKDIPYEFRQVDLGGDRKEYQPLETVELVFLDLDYKHGFLNPVDPYLCAEQIRQGIREGQQYYLVAWTKDPDDLPGVLEALRELNLLPVTSVAMKKVIYETSKNAYNIDQLFTDINIEFKKTEEVQEFLGRIIAVEEENVLINCILLDDPEVYEVRRFDLLPLQGHIDLVKGTVMRIKVTTKPGSRTYEFIQENPEKAKLFIKPDDFEDLDDLSFLTK